ncbi:MAG: tetratricopeptide repeat protein [Alphaproteobacteria bacterium]|nr:tetratricopeptide repeat protein [Alphaproteobacteria bacterium]
MTTNDKFGHALSGATTETAALYDRAQRQLLLYEGDPVATIAEAIERRPDFVMARVLHAYLHLLGARPDVAHVARGSLEAAEALPHTTREGGHLAAIRHLVEGRWHAAARALEDVAIDHPHDILALQAGQALDFFVGDSRMLRDRIARALPAWSPAMPDYHGVLGMHAFGLEEMGDYTAAERAGRRAIELEPRDSWAQHAVAHVCEMQGRQRDGIAWMRGNEDGWTRDNFFKVHNWWHLAMFHLDLGETDAVLKLYDESIYGTRTGAVLDMVDASAMLWRLILRGVDVGGRWQGVAEDWATLTASSNYAFNDAHAMMAFVGAGRRADGDAVLALQAAPKRDGDDNAAFIREVGAPVTQAIRAFGDGDHGTAIRLLRPARNIAARFGGSHAQRDLIDLTLIESALRAGEDALARALTAERMAVKPSSPWNRWLADRAMARAKAA